MKFSAGGDNVRILGRSLEINNVRYLNYSASGVEFEFTGRLAKADILTDGADGEEQLRCWMAVFIDDKFYKKFCLDKEEDNYILYIGEEVKKVKLKLIKLSEASYAKAGIKSICIDSNKVPVKTKEKERKIEIIGDSITCGYGIEGKESIDYFTTAEENVSLSYGIKTAEYFNADINLISYSCKGIITASVDKEVDDSLKDDWLMPMVYKYTDLGVSRDLKITMPEVWDNSKFIPDVIIVNLGTNDATYTRDIKIRIDTFGEGCYRFLEYIREHNKKAAIIYALGVMGKELCSEAEKQVRKFSENKNDDNIYFLNFELQDKKDGIGTYNHPSVKTHEKMAKQLINLIKGIKKW